MQLGLIFFFSSKDSAEAVGVHTPIADLARRGRSHCRWRRDDALACSDTAIAAGTFPASNIRARRDYVGI